MRILVVEDEPAMLEMLRGGLREHGHTVVTAADGLDGLELAVQYPFDMVVLDVLLPKMNGWQVVRELRRLRNQASVLILTACDGEPDVIEGLEAGADDYLTKPFSFPELLARIKSVARAKLPEPSNCLVIDTLILDCGRRQAFRSGRSLSLTRTELTLLECLVKSAGATVPRAVLMQFVWGDSSAVGRSTLDSFINLLRKKVDLRGEQKLVHTIKGVGYSVRAESGEPAVAQGILS
jgi:DNA-binding response OmpR family regulator